MIKGQCNHHKILETLSISGHGNKVLIADGNFPIMTNSNHNAEKVYLGLSKDLPTVTDVLKSILTVINIENVEVMDSAEKVEPEIFDEFREMTGVKSLEKYSRQDFYDICQDEDITLVINTGETRTFANILLTVGVTS
ncbi:RbsD/FucU family protein [Mammaliicoccus sciuri]|uniref:RbsD/FucU family protein n=1 Tax=Mammaliicoccus sciuri TaxID=1296 RepID=UPI003CC56266